MTSTLLTKLVAEQHTADLRRTAQRERAAASVHPPRRHPRVGLIVAAALLLAIIVAAPASAAGRIWVDAPGLNPLTTAVYQGYSVPVTVHNDTDMTISADAHKIVEAGPRINWAFPLACHASIPPGGQCASTVDGYAPSTGTFHGSLGVDAKDAAGAPLASERLPITITVYGFMAAAPSLNAGNQAVGTNGPPQAETVSTWAEVPLAVARITGPDADDFVISSDTCAGTTGPFGLRTCSVKVRFLPSTLGPRSAALVLTSAGVQYGSTQSIPLSGVGVAPDLAAKGDKGDPGIQGIQGQKGDPGTPGVQGIQGVQGTQGPQGIPGQRGATGATGPAGKPACRNVTVVKLLCDALFVPGTWSAGTTASIARVDLKRGHRVYATGKGKALRVLRRVGRGQYKLVVLRRSRSGKIVKTSRTVRVS